MTELMHEKKKKKNRSMPPFEPDLVFFEPDALNYPLGKELLETFKAKGIPIKMTSSHNRVTGIPGIQHLKLTAMQSVQW